MGRFLQFFTFHLRSPTTRAHFSFSSTIRAPQIHLERSQIGSSVSRNAPRTGRFLWKVFKFACIIFCINTYCVDIFVCIGSSMEPTIRSHDIVLTEHFTQRFGRLRRGDLVVARSPLNPLTIVCKRITATHGDLAFDEHNNLIKVPRGHVWLEGDNPADSFDSRRYGSVAEGLVLSKIFYRLWPPHRFGTFEDNHRDSSENSNQEIAQALASYTTTPCISP